MRTRTALLLAGLLPALTGALALPGPATAAPDVATTANAVNGQYVVVLDDDVADVDGTVKRLAKGDKVLRTYRTALKGFAVKTNAAGAKRIAADADVASVQQDGIVKANDIIKDVTDLATQTIPGPPSTYWGLNRIDQHPLPPNAAGSYNYFFSAPSVSVYVVDTGINFGHTEFGGRASLGVDLVGGISPPGADCYGHGTHVAGTIGGTTYGVAKSVKLKSVRVLDCSGSGTWSGVIAGFDWIAGHAARPAVMNASLGGGSNIAANIALNNLIESGVTAVVAAGNSADDACGYSPAGTLAAITVAATGNYENPSAPISDARSSFSNYGACVDLFAPGAHIKSAWIGSSSASAVISGTSMASPHVAGAAALYLSGSPTALPATVRNALVNFFATPGVVTNPGPGSPNKLLFTGGKATLSLDASPEPISKGGTVTSSGSLSIAGKALGGRSVQIWFDKSGSTAPVLKGSAITTSTGFYSRSFSQSADGYWFAVRPSESMILGAASPADYVDCSNC